MLRHIVWVPPLALLVLASGPPIFGSTLRAQQLPEQSLPEQLEQAFDPDQRIPYSLNIRGLDDIELKQRFLALSLLNAEAPRNRNAARIDSRSRLRSRLATDVDTLDALLKSEGYYAAKITPKIVPAPGLNASVVVVLAVEPGAQYQFGEVNLGAALNLEQLGLSKTLGLQAGAAARSAVILAARDVYGANLPQQGYPFFLLGKRDVIVDHDSKTVDVMWPVDLGPKARIGEIKYVGTEVAKPGHLARLPRFKSGDSYDSRKVDDFREALLTTGLYGAINVYPQYASDGADGVAVADVIVDGQPTTQKTISLIGGYNTNEGPRSEVNWQHRNLFGGEERLTLRAVLGTIEQSTSVNLQKFNFGSRDQTLLSTLGFAHFDNDTLEAFTYSVSGGLERQNLRFLQRRWTYSLLAQVGLEDVKRGGTVGTFYTLGLPSNIRYDGTDNLFDPRKGFRIAYTIVPEVVVRGGARFYVVNDLQASIYKSVGGRFPITLALRGRAGVIAGTDLTNIPATRRFYSGGGGSIRGYNFQGISPLDIAGRRLGGRSVNEASFEARIKLTKAIGLVPFIDAGAVYTSSLPKLNDIRWGAGIGLRYYTDFAPFRLDIATPLNRRVGDPPVAIYFSIGQSF
jgi:translocation and assembly module TamA